MRGIMREYQRGKVFRFGNDSGWPKLLGFANTEEEASGMLHTLHADYCNVKGEGMSWIRPCDHAQLEAWNKPIRTPQLKYDEFADADGNVHFSRLT